MTELRPECVRNPDGRPAILDRYDLLKALAKSVGRRRTLIRGVLEDEDGKHCAMGLFWEDHPKLAVHYMLIDEIAAVNDKAPRASPRARWKRVYAWIKKEVEKYEEAK